MPKKKHLIPESLSSSQLLSKHKSHINKSWSNQQDWTNLHNRGLIYRSNKSILLPYNNIPLIETIHVQVSLQIDNNHRISIYFSNLNVDTIPNPVLYLYTNKIYHFKIMDPRISLLFLEEKDGHFLNLNNTINNPLANTQQRLTVEPQKILNGCYTIATSFFLELSQDKKQIYTVTAGNKIYILRKNYSQNYRMLTSPGYNLLINLRSKPSRFYGLLEEIFGKIKKELSSPTYFYQDINPKIWRLLYDQNNRLNLLSILLSFDFITEKKVSQIFPNYQYLTNSEINIDHDNINRELSSLSLMDYRRLSGFLTSRNHSVNLPSYEEIHNIKSKKNRKSRKR